MYNLFLDDNRSPNKFLKDIRTWVVATNYQEFVETITKQGLPKFISFDHDLAFEHYPTNESLNVVLNYNNYKNKTGYDCAKWLLEYCMDNGIDLPEYQIHSMNPVGAENIRQLLENYKTHIKNI